MKTRKLGVVLLALLLAAMAMVPMVIAQNNTTDGDLTNHFRINFDTKNVTHFVAYNITSKTELNSYGIQKPEELTISSQVNKFDVVTFDHPSLNDQLKSGKGITISMGGKDYQTELSRMNFENISDGVDSYHGTFPGIKNSDILFTAGENVLIGRVTLENETIWIIPVEPLERAAMSESPLHIIYSSKDVSDTEFPIDSGTVKINGDNSLVTRQVKSLNLQLTPPAQTVYVNILVVTDREFFERETDWVASAQNIIAEANWVLSTDDIRVQLEPIYDATRRNQFSDNPEKNQNPLLLLTQVYLPSDLNYYSSDIALYLGGNDKITDNDQGGSYGFTQPPVYCRYAWAQMVPDDLFYMGTEHGRQVISIHEIGHMFDAGHETRDVWEPQYARAFFNGLKMTVMWSGYTEYLSLTHFSSNDQGIFMGDDNHDNSQRISKTRDIVANYASIDTTYKDKIGVYQNGVWYRDFNGWGVYPGVTSSFGATGYVPVVGDWNLEGTTKIGVTNGASWYLDYNGDGVYNTGDKTYSFGATGWTPIVGDWNHDGKTKIGVTNGASWYLDYNGDGVYNTGDKTYSFGTTGWTPIVGDWNYDGKTKIGVYQNGIWYLDYNGNGVWDAGETPYNFGATGWTPLVGKWN
jgi:hypothetical protein